MTNKTNYKPAEVEVHIAWPRDIHLARRVPVRTISSRTLAAVSQSDTVNPSSRRPGWPARMEASIGYRLGWSATHQHSSLLGKWQKRTDQSRAEMTFVARHRRGRRHLFGPNWSAPPFFLCIYNYLAGSFLKMFWYNRSAENDFVHSLSVVRTSGAIRPPACSGLFLSVWRC